MPSAGAVMQSSLHCLPFNRPRSKIMVRVRGVAAPVVVIEVHLDQCQDPVTRVVRDARDGQHDAAVHGAPRSAAIADVLAHAERRHILDVGSRCRWNRSAMARVLGIDRKTLYQHLRRLQLDIPSYRR